MTAEPATGLALGDRIELEVTSVAHGGICVGRHEGQVVFVRGALPGERVTAEVTGLGRGGRYARAVTLEVGRAAPGRREPLCPVADRCGGCDWQHATEETARGLKAEVVREALDRFAGIVLPEELTVQQVPMPPHADVPAGLPPRLPGLGWRTRGTLATDAGGRAGMRAPRSHEVIVAGQCPQLDPRLVPLDLFARSWPPEARVRFVVPSVGEPQAHVDVPSDRDAEPGVVVERAAGRDFSVAADGFWQVHPGAADALVGHVRRMLDPRPDERLLDLYSGVGLFGISLAAGAERLRVRMVEGDRTACALAARNAVDLDVTVTRADVARWVTRRGGVGRPDIVVLDPPRTGAGPAVVRAVAAARPRAVAYVACDPVALARDLGTFAARGFRLRELVALDLFPTTHHVECVALLEPGSGVGPGLGASAFRASREPRTTGRGRLTSSSWGRATARQA